MTRAAFVVALAAALALVGCNGCAPVKPPPTSPADAAAIAPAWDGSTPATCLDLCRHGQALSCKWADPTPAGATCVDVCLNNQQAGITPWDLDCRTRATTCASPSCR